MRLLLQKPIEFAINLVDLLMLKSITLLLFISLAFHGSSQSAVEKKISVANKLYYTYPDSAYQIAKSIDTKKLNASESAKLSLLKARCSLLMTDYVTCEKELRNAESIFRKNGDKAFLADVLSLYNILSQRIGDKESSRKYIKEAYVINKELGDVDAIARTLNNLASEFLVSNEPDSARIYLTLLDDIKADLEKNQHYYINQNWGVYYNQKGEYRHAHDYFTEALKIAEKYQMVDSKATILMLIGRNYENASDYGNAEKYALESYLYSSANNLLLEKSEALEVRLSVAEKKGDFFGAFSLQKEFLLLKDSILNIDKLSAVRQVKSQLDLAEKEKEIATQKANAAQSELEKETTQSQNKLLLLSLLAVVLILFSLAYAFIKNKKLYSIISLQKKEVEQKNTIISEALKDIDDSLTYSKFIQNALLPSDKSFEIFEDFFILFKPKEKVSGDFYWLYQKENVVYFCVADCTGHGVPGALVSVVGANALNSCLKEFKLTEPGAILDKMATIVEETLFSQDRNMRDGMDLALCKLDLHTNVLTFSGANNPLYVISASGIQILATNKQPVGKFENRKPFNQERIQLEKGDCLYLFTDGFADQFGGPKGKKFMYKKFRDLLEKNTLLQLSEQKDELNTQFEQWRGSLEQIDDVCVIGVRV